MGYAAALKNVKIHTPKKSDTEAKIFKVSSTNDTHFIGASKARRQTGSWTPHYSSANTNYSQWSRREIQARCQHAVDNMPLAKAALKRNVNNVVGTGLKLNVSLDHEALGISQIQAAVFEAEFERKFKLWANNPKECDAAAKRSFVGLQRQVFSSKYTLGDAIVATPFVQRMKNIYSLKLQLIEGSRLSNPNNTMNTSTMSDGVETGRLGDDRAFHVLEAHPNDIANIEKSVTWKRLEAFGRLSGLRRVFHVGSSDDRIGQTRSISPLANILEGLFQIDRLGMSELFAANLASDPAVAITTDADVELEDFGGDDETLENEAPVEFGSDAADEIRFQPGAVIDLAPGEKITSHSPGRPNPNYEPFVFAKYREFAAGISTPVEILLMHFLSSFTAARAAFVEYWKYVMVERDDLVMNFCTPSYHLWFEDAVNKSIITVPGFGDAFTRALWLQHEWIGEPMGQIQPQKAAAAAKTRIEIGISSEEKEAALIGNDIRIVTRQKANHQRMKIELMPTPEIIVPGPLPILQD